jgi:hypothetical protein
MLTFPPIDPDAVKVLTFDFTQALGPNEVLQGGAQLLGVTCTAGFDPSPMTIVIGPPSYDITGIKILIPVGNLSIRNGNDYEFEVASATNFKPEVIVGRALLQVRIS